MSRIQRPLLAHGGAATGVVAAVAVIVLLEFAQAVFVPVAAAVVLAFLLAAPVRALRRLHVPDYLAAGLVVAALLGSTVLLGSSLATPAAQWWERAPSAMQQLLAQLERLGQAIPLLRATRGPAPAPAGPASSASAPAANPAIRDKLASEGIALTGALLGRTATFALAAASTVILLYFLLASERWLLARTVEAIAERRTRLHLLAALRRAQREIGRFLGALALTNLAVGMATAVALWLLDLPNPTLWGTVAGVLNFVPYIGPVIMGTLLLLAGVLSFDQAPAMMAPAAAFLAIHATESNLISPWFIGRRVTLSPLAVFVAVLFFGWLWGLAGAMLAVPLLIGLRCTLRRSHRFRMVCVYLDGEARGPRPTEALQVRRHAAGTAAAVEHRLDDTPRS